MLRAGAASASLPRTRDHRLHGEARQRGHLLRRNGGAWLDGLPRQAVGGLHVEPLRLALLNANRGEPLDPVIPGPAGNREAERGSVRVGERRAVHAEDDEGRRVHRARHRDRSDERRHGRLRWKIGASQLHVRRARHGAGALEQVSEADARPGRLSHRAVNPLHARHARLVKGSAISGALKDRREADLRENLEVGETEVQAPADAPLDAEAAATVQRRRAEMAPDEEDFGRRQQAVEPLDRRREILGVEALDEERMRSSRRRARSEAGAHEDPAEQRKPSGFEELTAPHYPLRSSLVV